MASIENPVGPESKDKESVTDNPSVDKYNVDVAEALANEALRRPIAEAVPIYEQLVATFPTAAKYWKQYIEAHMAINNDDAVRLVFGRCLLTCPQVPLWLCYIRYIRKVNEKRGMEGHEEIKKAFEFTLNFVGADIASGPVWMEYIGFLKILPFLGAQDSQRMLALRKVYQGAILTPTHHVEQLWKDYENFENSVNRQLAKALLSEYQSKYNSAKAVYRERKKYIDEIDWNMLAVPPAGSSKEEMQWMAWKRLLAFEKGNPQRIDAASANKRVEFTYEQCLMYLYHYPDIWYDYATWHAKAGSIDTAVKVFQRALEALPDSELLRYAYVELEESRGANLSAKKIFEGLLAEDTKNAALAHIQYIRFLRRTEGIEAARKYFVDARNSQTCTYHVYVAYANMAFCLDKEPKLAHNVFEAGTKRFMHEPAYILEYVDFLSRLNDDINIRALFERALSSLPAERSAEVWKRFIQFEQTYGDLTRMLKVEQRRKEALSGIAEDGGSGLEGSLQDIVSRHSFMDLWPCSSNDLEHLSRQEWLAKNIRKRSDKSSVANGAGLSGLTSNLSASGNVIYPDTSKMVAYDPRQKPGFPVPNATTSALPVSVPPSNLPTPFTAVHGGSSNTVFDEILKATPALAAFLASLPPVEGPTPDVDIVLSICVQSNIPAAVQVGKLGTHKKQQMSNVPDVSNSSKSFPNRSTSSFKGGDRKRKHPSRQEDNDSLSVQSQPLPTDLFRIRQMQKARATSSQTGSATASYGSALSGDFSGSTS